MIEEAYVSFETAKLLKEKGFDEKCLCYYEDNTSCNEGINFSNWFGNKYSNSEIGRRFAVPTQQMTMRWFREVHNIGIFPSTYTHISNGKTVHSYGTAIINLKTYELMTDSYLSNDTYEGAVEDAIKYCLENLI